VANSAKAQEKRRFQFALLHAILKAVIRRATTLVLAATVSFFAFQPLPTRTEGTSEGSAIVWLQDISSRKRVEVESSTQAKSHRVLKLYFRSSCQFISGLLSQAFEGRAPPLMSAAAI
jgi:hypothetical protein